MKAERGLFIYFVTIVVGCWATYFAMDRTVDLSVVVSWVIILHVAWMFVWVGVTTIWAELWKQYFLARSSARLYEHMTVGNMEDKEEHHG